MDCSHPPSKMGKTEADRAMMRRCLMLAARAEGRTSPNPMVGAIVARAGRVIAEAWHQRAGTAHAEAAALGKAGNAARGATLYVNLEPCCHFGRTPPCVDAIIEAGIRRVVTAHRDPFSRVRGRGHAALRRAGVRVDSGVLRDEALQLNEAYLVFVERRRPFVLVKAAMTLDGRIATAAGQSRWISSAASRIEAHRLRARHDAVIIGSNTALSDDPRLTARHRAGGEAGAGRPWRVVLDSRLRLGPKARLLRVGSGVIVYTLRRASQARAKSLARAGADVVRLGADAEGRVDLVQALRDLARRGALRVMIEGGGELIASAFSARVVDKVAFFVAPIVVGGRGATPVVGGRGADKLRQGFRLTRLEVSRVGDDLLVQGYVAGPKR